MEMFDRQVHVNKMLLATVVAGGILVFNGMAQSATPGAAAAGQPAPAAHSRYQPSHFSKRAGEYYQFIWGVDSLAAKSAESGEIIRFTFRVLDGTKAGPLNDKKFEPSLIDPQAGVKLVIPALENVGSLRQTGTPVAGMSYWMAFSNKGRRVKRGDHVNVVIGSFHADGLVVE
jgi:hypothetical protein